MPWKTSSVMDERVRFVLEQESDEQTMTELCEIYEISRQTGYYWVQRYQQGGLEALQDLSRAPGRHPNQTPEQIEQAVLGLRRRRMTWGPRKLKSVLERRRPAIRWPAASTIGALLAREGLIVPRKKRRRVPGYTRPFAAADAPNRVWCVDFKGWFKTRDGARIDPLTISDAHSRYLLRCQQVEKTDEEHVRAIFESAFRQWGMPEAIRSDNGAPFASRAIAGISRLSLWWMKLGIVPERIQAGHPEQNGRHERMHGTLKRETASPPAANRRAQQAAFDRFRREYNEERPHEALQMQTPSAVHERSMREYPARVREPEYGDGMLVRRVPMGGQFKWKGERVFVSETLTGEPIGLQPEDERMYTIYFAAFPIGRFDSYQRTVLPLAKQADDFKVAAGEEENPLPLHPIPSDHKNKKCQGCARSKMSTMSPNGYCFAPTVLGAMT
jgi:putative transposase